MAYALLGCTWLIMKTEGALQHRMKALAQPMTIVRAGDDRHRQPLDAIVASGRSGAVVFAAEHHLLRAGAYTCLLTTWAILRTLRRDSHAAPFLLALLLLFLGYSGLAISLWPNIIPPAISIWDAAAPPESMGFTLVGALFIIPFILAYTAWSYYVFRGKVRAGEGYH